MKRSAYILGLLVLFAILNYCSITVRAETYDPVIIEIEPDTIITVTFLGREEGPDYYKWNYRFHSNNGWSHFIFELTYPCDPLEDDILSASHDYEVVTDSSTGIYGIKFEWEEEDEVTVEIWFKTSKDYNIGNPPSPPSGSDPGVGIKIYFKKQTYDGAWVPGPDSNNPVFCIPEIPIGTIIGMTSMFVALAIYVRRQNPVMSLQ